MARLILCIHSVTCKWRLKQSNMMILCLLLCILSTEVLGNGDFVEGEYLLRLRDSLIQTNAQQGAFVDLLKSRFGVQLKKELKMASTRILHVSANDVDRISELSEVLYAVQNTKYYTSQSCTQIASPRTWGLDRLDQPTKLVSVNPLNPDAKYTLGDHIGTDVYAYMVDTGIDLIHSEFEGRAIWGHSAGTFPEFDDSGHGTHCAGIVGSKSYGVAKGITLVAVKVLNENGYGEAVDIVEGLNWVLTNHTERAVGVVPKSVVNLSFSGAPNALIDEAVENLVTGGVVVAVSAGNSDKNACLDSPARAPLALTVGATDVNDVTAQFSNYGTCLDIYAPGVDIMSTWLGGTQDILSGTSMASPHVAGVAALYQSSFPSDGPTPSKVEDFIKNSAVQGVLTFYDSDHATSNNTLLNIPCPIL